MGRLSGSLEESRKNFPRESRYSGSLELGSGGTTQIRNPSDAFLVAVICDNFEEGLNL
jgi:hypothetical protein